MQMRMTDARTAACRIAASTAATVGAERSRIELGCTCAYMTNTGKQCDVTALRQHTTRPHAANEPGKWPLRALFDPIALDERQPF